MTKVAESLEDLEERLGVLENEKEELKEYQELDKDKRFVLFMQVSLAFPRGGTVGILVLTKKWKIG